MVIVVSLGLVSRYRRKFLEGKASTDDGDDDNGKDQVDNKDNDNNDDEDVHNNNNNNQDSTTFRHNSLDLGPSFTVHHSKEGGGSSDRESLSKIYSLIKPKAGGVFYQGHEKSFTNEQIEQN